MTSKAATPDQYIKELPADRKAAIIELRKTILKNLPKGFKETMGYGMLGYVVPHEIYPDGYHCDPKLPLPFMGLASQKNFIAFYHMGVYAMPGLLKWYKTEFAKQGTTKLDMGKSCTRFKIPKRTEAQGSRGTRSASAREPEHIPYQLIGQLVKKVSVKKWIEVYEKNIKR